MLTVEKLKRTFDFTDSSGTKHKLTDPGLHMHPREVMKFYAGTHPELTTAKIIGPKIEDNKQVFSIKSQVGEKG